MTRMVANPMLANKSGAQDFVAPDFFAQQPWLGGCADRPSVLRQFESDDHRTMPLSQRFRHRLIRHHLPLTVACAIAVPLIAIGVLDGKPAFRWSMATAYVALILLAITLSIGPWYALKLRRAPLSSDLRRDFGIWTGLISLAHVAIGLQAHMGSMLLYFFVGTADGRWTLRVDAFGLTNWVGLGATCVFVLLLALSNDWSLRRLGRKRWKSLQRYVYPSALFVVLHGVVYQVLEQRSSRWVLVFASTVVFVAVVQSLGYRQARTHSS